MSTPEQMREIAEEAAMKAVDMTFLHLGVDINDPRQVAAMKEHFAFLARMSRGAREVKSVIIKTCVGALVTGLLALVALGFKDWIMNLFSNPPR